MNHWLAKVASENPQKLEELTAFHWFTKADRIEYQCVGLSERPDFLMEVDGRSIGVEITLAERSLLGTRFSARQIEEAQREFAESLLARVEPKLPLEIGLIFNDEIPVDNATAPEALNAIVPLINRVSEEMQPHSVERLVRDEADMSRRAQHRLHVCKAIPNFLQHIQLFNDGHQFTMVCGSRGGVVEDFGERELGAILERKHKVLKGYKRCDEQWLVIVAGVLPPIYVSDEPPKILISTMASAFGGIAVSTPIQSEFERVCFFQSPANVFQLKP